MNLRIPVGKFESEGNGLRVNAMGAAHHGCVFEFPSSAFENFRQPPQILRNDLRGLADQQSLRGVDHVVRSQSIMKPARFGTDELRDGSSEGNDVVTHFRFDFMDAFDFEIGPLADSLRCGFGNYASFRQRFGGGDFYREPVRKRFSSLQMRPISGRV